VIHRAWRAVCRTGQVSARCEPARRQTRGDRPHSPRTISALRLDGRLAVGRSLDHSRLPLRRYYRSYRDESRSPRGAASKSREMSSRRRGESFPPNGSRMSVGLLCGNLRDDVQAPLRLAVVLVGATIVVYRPARPRRAWSVSQPSRSRCPTATRSPTSGATSCTRTFVSPWKLGEPSERKATELSAPGSGGGRVRRLADGLGLLGGRMAAILVATFYVPGDTRRSIDCSMGSLETR
jgi:hypothetical protein